MVSVKDSYNRICDKWDEYRKNCPINKCVADFAENLKSGERVLDVGCGTGYPIAAYLAERGFFVHGIDISENMIKKANSLNLANASFELRDFLDYSSDAKYGAIVAFDSLWYIRHSRQKEVFKKAASLLKDGGMFLFTYGKTDGEVMGEMFGASFYNSSLDYSVTKDCLIQNGFKIIEFTLDYKEKTSGTRDLLVVAQLNA